jgi:hypothetical protein
LRLGYSKPVEIEDPPMLVRSFSRLDFDHLAHAGLGVTAIGPLGAYDVVPLWKPGRSGSEPRVIATIEKAQMGRRVPGQNV